MVRTRGDEIEESSTARMDRMEGLIQELVTTAVASTVATTAPSTSCTACTRLAK